MIIRRVGPVSCGKIAGTLYGIIGLVVGAVVSLIAVTGAFSPSPETAAMGAMVGVGAIVAFPLLYGGLAAICFILGAALYNVIAGLVGGIEIDLE